MKTTWQRTLKDEESNDGDTPLLKDKVADVVIIGSGLTGSTLAYLLARKAFRVVVIEKGTMTESSNTAYTTAFLTSEIDTALQDLVKMFGERKAKAVWESGREAINAVEKIVNKLLIDCEFMRVPEFVFSSNPSEWEIVKKEAETAKKFSFEIEIKEKHEGTLPFPNEGYIVIPNQAKFHPLKYGKGLKDEAKKLGVEFFENIEALGVGENGHGTIITRVKRDDKNFSLRSKWVVIATHNPFNHPLELFAKTGTYTTYVLELSIPKGILEEGLYLDAHNPYHYFRVDRGALEKDRMILGGEDHRKEIKMDEEKNYAALFEFADQILTGHPYKEVTRWSGEIIETIDGLPYIGLYSRKHPNILVATGYSGNGMTYSMIAGKILADRILGGLNVYESLYDPARKYSATSFFIKFRDYAGEFFNGALKNIFRKGK